MTAAWQLKSGIMENTPDINKVLHQHVEMNDFFSGGFTVGKKAQAHEENETSRSNTDEKIELDRIADEVRQCHKCRLGSLRENAVPGEGNAMAQIFFIGEGPGAEEDAQGRPFVGRAGQLLDRIITAMKLRRSDVFIGNILKCRPPENRDPKPDEIITCLPYLQRQIEVINPRIIVALGAHAARTLLGTNKPIGALRGRFHEYIPGFGKDAIKIMATYHPAYLLRNYSQDNRRRVWEDRKSVV